MWRNGGGDGVFVPSPPLWKGEKKFWYVGVEKRICAPLARHPFLKSR